MGRIMASKMFGSFGASEPVENYGRHHEYYKLSYRLKCNRYLQCDFYLLTNIIIAENKLRKSIEREERLEIKSRVPETSMGDEVKELHRCGEELKARREDIDLRQRDLCDRESLPSRKPLKEVYDRIRQKLTWYLQEDLVNDCKERGGCCS